MKSQRDSVPGFPARLAALRTLADLTRAQLAERAGLSMPTIHRLESGSRTPSLHSAWVLARALGCDINEFFPKEPYVVVENSKNNSQ